MHIYIYTYIYIHIYTHNVFKAPSCVVMNDLQPGFFSILWFIIPMFPSIQRLFADCWSYPILFALYPHRSITTVVHQHITHQICLLAKFLIFIWLISHKSTSHHDTSLSVALNSNPMFGLLPLPDFGLLLPMPRGLAMTCHRGISVLDVDWPLRAHCTGGTDGSRMRCHKRRTGHVVNIFYE